MNKTVLISYSTENYKKFQLRLNENAKFLNCFDEIISYDDFFIKKTNFYKTYENILNCKRGAGYWLWKPFILLETLNNFNEGDLIIYLDSQHIIHNRDIINFINENLDNGVFLTKNDGINGLNKKYTKRDCFVLMNCDEEYYWNTEQVEAGQIAFKVSNFSKFIIKEWLKYCQNENIITDLPNICGKDNFPEFVDHRHDQSILTNLILKYGFLRRIPLSILSNYIGESRI